MDPVLDKFGKEIHVGSIVAISTGSGMYVGRVTKFNWSEGYDWHTKVTETYLASVQTILTTGRKQSYDFPERRMINLDTIHQTEEVRNL